MYLYCIILIFFSFPLFAGVIPGKIVPDLSSLDDAGGEAMCGGYALQVFCPQGVEDLQWEKNQFSLTFSVGIVEGKVVSVVGRSRNDEAMKWMDKFEESCIKALKQWRFSKAWTKKGELKEWGMTLHVDFQMNKFGECNISVNQGVTRIYLMTNPQFKN